MYRDLAGKIDAQLSTLRTLISSDLVVFNEMVRTRNVPAVVVKPKKDAAAGAGETH